MKITPETLKEMGCVPYIPTAMGGPVYWFLRARGYYFIFKPRTDPLINKGKPTWMFYLSEKDMQRGVGHAVDHFDECFVMIADDMYEAGKGARSREILDLLSRKVD